MKTLSLRLPDEQAAALEAIAQADEMSVSETIRQAIDSQIKKRRDDAEFQKRLRVAMARNQKALEVPREVNAGTDSRRKGGQRRAYLRLELHGSEQPPHSRRRCAAPSRQRSNPRRRDRFARHRPARDGRPDSPLLRARVRRREAQAGRGQ